MKKSIVIAFVVALLGAVVAPVVFNSIRYRINPLAAAFISLMDGTEWAPNYSYSKFKNPFQNCIIWTRWFGFQEDLHILL